MNKCQNCQAILPDRIDGQRGRQRKYCNRFCFAIHRGYRKTIFKPENCLWCKVPLNQDNKPGNPKKFCSKKHNDKYRHSLRPKAPIVQKTCLYCSKLFSTNVKASRFCSTECRNKFYGTVKKQINRAKKIIDPRRFDFHCDRCNQLVQTDTSITRGKYGRFCRPCALVRRRERYRVKTAKRQGVAKPARLSADALIERDGNLCRLCNTEIDLSLARNSRFGATIDHIVPLSLGGSDDIENMQLAHWICNIKKGNRV